MAAVRIDALFNSPTRGMLLPNRTNVEPLWLKLPTLFQCHNQQKPNNIIA